MDIAKLAAPLWRATGGIPTVGELVAEPINLAWSRQTRYGRRAVLTAVEHLTRTGTLRLAFEVLDDEPFKFMPGQFIGIAQKLPKIGLRKSPYCLISPPTAERRFELLVRVVPQGPLSQYLGSLEVGDVIPFRGPNGRSMAPNQPGTELVLFATGVGIGPFLGLTRHLLAVGDLRPIRLFWGLRLAEDLCLVDELDELARVHPAFGYHISLSQPPPNWAGLRGRITETAPSLLGDADDKQFVLCGNGAMITEMHAALSDLGIPGFRIHREHYFNSTHRPDPDIIAAIRHRFAGGDLPSPMDQLEVAASRSKPEARGEEPPSPRRGDDPASPPGLQPDIAAPARVSAQLLVRIGDAQRSCS